MKKIFAILTLMVAFAVNADYLYWMVGTPDPASRPNFGGTDVTFTDWTYAKLVLSENASQDNSYSTENAIAVMTSGTAAFLKEMDAYAYADIGNAGAYSGKTFLIELYASDESYLGFASAAASNLSSYIFEMGGMSATVGAGWMATSFHVPEPTSGMLFLLGGMLLGLRRRRMA